MYSDQQLPICYFIIVYSARYTQTGGVTETQISERNEIKD